MGKSLCDRSESDSLSAARACVSSDFTGSTGSSGSTEQEAKQNQHVGLAPAKKSHRCQPDPAGSTPELQYAEALALPLVVWADLPLPSSVRVHLASGRVLWVSASRARSLEARAAVEAFFGPPEYLALAVGLVARRCGPREVEAWAARKGRELGWTLSATEAVAGAVGLLVPAERERVLATTGPGGRALTVGALVALMGGTVEAVLVEGVVAPTTAANGAARALEAM